MFDLGCVSTECAFYGKLCHSQRTKFASTVGKCRGFCRGISMFFSNWILRNLKKVFFQPRIRKYIFLFKKRKRNVLLNKKRIFIFYTIFKLSWCRWFTVLSADVCFLFSYFCCSLIPVFKTQGIERMLTLFYQYKWQKFNKMNEKRILGYHSVSIEYVTG